MQAMSPTIAEKGQAPSRPLPVPAALHLVGRLGGLCRWSGLLKACALPQAPQCAAKYAESHSGQHAIAAAHKYAYAAPTILTMPGISEPARHDAGRRSEPGTSFPAPILRLSSSEMTARTMVHKFDC